MRYVILLIGFLIFGSCTNQDTDEQRIKELESRVESLNSQIREQKISQSENVEREDNSNKKTSENNQYQLPTYEELNCEQFTKAEIVSVEQRKDQSFNDYLIVEIKNNYNTTIRSVRISSSGWIEKDNGFFIEKVRAKTETKPVTIRPGHSASVRLQDNWGTTLKEWIVVDGVIFSDGSYDESRPETEYADC